jgi:hypothetical protein
MNPDPDPPILPAQTDPSVRSFNPRLRWLAILSYRLACAGPLAFWVIALFYPPTDPRALPTPLVQGLCWWLCLCSPVGLLLGAALFFRFHTTTLGSRRMGINYTLAAIVVGALASLALLLGIPGLDGVRRFNHIGNRSCVSNLKQLNLALTMYAQDYDDHYPLANTWNDALQPYTKNPSLFNCSEAPDAEHRPTFAMNSHLKETVQSRIKFSDRTVTLFDSVAGVNLEGGRELFPDPPRHFGSQTVGFVDGHVKQIATDHLAELLWKP